jgi:glycosyltransferase involved in cell wall biosynthesis
MKLFDRGREWLAARVKARSASTSRRLDVTVVIPIFNKGSYLRACLESVLGQAAVSLEVVCVDDCSTDGSGDIAQEFARRDGRLQFIRNVTNCGAAYSRNIAISLARGRYLQFTDADDVLPPGSLAALLEAAERSGAEVTRGNFQALQHGVLTPAGHLIDLDGNLWPTPVICRERVGTLLDLPELWIPWFHPCFLLSRDLLAREGARYPPLTRGEDPVFIARVLTQARRICVIPRTTYWYRQEERRPSPTCRALQDYVAHAGMVKEAYAGAHMLCWNTYGDFIKSDIRMLLAQSDVTAAELKALKSQIESL